MIYVASRTKHVAKWRELRQHYPIISSWIDQAGPGETPSLSSLWSDIADEICSCGALVLYVEPDDFPLCGAFIEVGMMLGVSAMMASGPMQHETPNVFVAAPNVSIDPVSFKPLGSWLNSPHVAYSTALNALDQAMIKATSLVRVS